MIGITPAQALVGQVQADQAAGIVEYFIIGVSSLMGAGALAGFGYLAWQSAKAMKHMGHAVAAAVRTGAGIYGAGAGAAGKIAGSTAAKTGAAAAGAAGTSTADGGTASTAGTAADGNPGGGRWGRYTEQFKAGEWERRNPGPSAYAREGAMGIGPDGSGTGRRDYDLAGLRAAPNHSVKNVYLNPEKLRADEFSSLAQKTAPGGALYVQDQTGREETWMRNTAGAFYRGGEPAGEVLSAADIRAQYYPSESSAGSAGAKGGTA